MTEVPDYVTSVPSAPGVHTGVAIDSPGIDQANVEQGQLNMMCFRNLSAFPCLASFMNIGSGLGAKGSVGTAVAGGQSVADTAMGYATGQPEEDVTADQALGAAAAVSGAATANPIAASVVAEGQAAGSTGSVAADAIQGGQSIAGTTTQIITGDNNPSATVGDVTDAANSALQQNTSYHMGAQSLTTAQSVSLKDQNLLVAEDFNHSSTVAVDPDGNWEWDGTDNAPSTNVLGCLKATANGTLLEYLSSEIPVVEGENIEVACQAKTEGLTYTGTDPAVVGVQRYRRMRYADGSVVYADVGGVDVDTLASPTADQDWTGLAGIYTVESKVDQIRLRFKVEAAATAGDVKFDAGALLKLDLISDEAVPGVGVTVDNIVTQLYGSAGEGFTHNDAAVALANTSNALMSANARISALEAQGYTGAIAGDNFDFTGEITANANWDGGYASGTDYGYYYADGGNAVWVPMGWVWSAANQWAYFDYVGADAASDTDYQLVQLLLSSPPQYAVGGWPYYIPYHSYIYLVGRIGSGWGSYVYAYIGSDGYYDVGYYSGGASHSLSDGYTDVPGSGSLLSFHLGDFGTTAPRKFKLMVNSDTITEFTEGGTASPLGASNRKWGWAAYAQAGAGDWGLSFVQGTPPAVNQFLAYDTGV